MKIKNKYTLLFLITIFLSLSWINLANAGIVPCGLGDRDPCTLCHLIMGFKKIVDWGTSVLLVAAMAGITIAGVMYAVSSGSSEQMETAKRFFSYSLAGFVIVLCGWLIVNTVILMLSAKSDLGVGATNWYTFTCDTTSSALNGPGGNQSGALNDAIRAGCESWCDQGGGTPEYIAQCRQGCANPTANPAAVQAGCESWCEQGGGTPEYIAQCKQGCVSAVTNPGTSPTAACGQVVNAGNQMMGWTYSQGQRYQSGYADCSSFVNRSFQGAGCSNPGNTTAELYPRGEPITDRSSLRAGDAIVYREGGGGHTAICQNDGCSNILHASMSRGQVLQANSSFMLNHDGVRVLRASNYCNHC